MFTSSIKTIKNIYKPHYPKILMEDVDWDYLYEQWKEEEQLNFKKTINGNR